MTRLTEYRHEGESSSPEAMVGLNRWVAFFAGCSTRSVVDAGGFEARVRTIQDGWRDRVGGLRRNSTADLLVAALHGTPIATVNGVSKMLGRSFRAANGAIVELVSAGVLRQVSVGRRNRAFEAIEIIDAFTDLERQLASPEGDTPASPPSRTVPARRQGEDA